MYSSGHGGLRRYPAAASANACGSAEAPADPRARRPPPPEAPGGGGLRGAFFEPCLLWAPCQTFPECHMMAAVSIAARLASHRATAGSTNHRQIEGERVDGRKVLVLWRQGTTEEREALHRTNGWLLPHPPEAPGGRGMQLARITWQSNTYDLHCNILKASTRRKLGKVASERA